MRRSAMIAVFGTMLALCACSGTAGEANQSGSAERAGATDAQRIAGMTAGERNGVFFRALLDAGHDCRNVVSSRRTGESDGVPIWQVVCRGGRSWFIAVTPNGYAQILRPGPEESEAANAHANAAERP